MTTDKGGIPVRYRVVDGVIYKICSKCGIEKPENEFYKHGARSGMSQNECILYSKCKQCSRKYPAGRIIYQDGDPFKRCARCRAIKSVDEFFKLKKSKSGYNSWCKQCVTDAYYKKHQHLPPRTDMDENGKPIGRTCSWCGKYKSAEHFLLEKRGTLRNPCKQCYNESKSKGHSYNPEIARRNSEAKELRRNGKKRCTNCKEIKDISDFHSHGNRHINPKCKDCMNAWMAGYRIRAADKRKAYAKEYNKRERTKELIRNANKKHREAYKQSPEYQDVLAKRQLKRDEDARLRELAKPHCPVCGKRTKNNDSLCFFCKSKFTRIIRHQAVHSRNISSRRIINETYFTCGACGDQKEADKSIYCKKCRNILHQLRLKDKCRSDPEYHKKHTERIKSNTKKWMEKNPDKARDMKRRKYHKKQARERGAEGNFTTEDLQSLKESCNNRCLLCGSTENLSIDHVIPIALGGTSNPSNLQILCHLCNSYKSDSTIIDYRWRIFHSMSIDLEQPQFSNGKLANYLETGIRK